MEKPKKDQKDEKEPEKEEPVTFDLKPLIYALVKGLKKNGIKGTITLQPSDAAHVKALRAAAKEISAENQHIKIKIKSIS